MRRSKRTRGEGLTVDYCLADLGLARLYEIAPISDEMTLNHIGSHGLGLPRSTEAMLGGLPEIDGSGGLSERRHSRRLNKLAYVRIRVRHP
jgi:hypothetical protein